MSSDSAVNPDHPVSNRTEKKQKRVQRVKRLIKALKSFPYAKSLESFKLTEKMKQAVCRGSDINVTAQRK